MSQQRVCVTAIVQRLKSRAGLGQISVFLGAITAAKDGVPVWKSTEARNNVPVGNGIAQVVLIAQIREQGNGAVLISQVFAVLEWHIQKYTLLKVKALVEALIQGLRRHSSGHIVRGKSTRVVPEYIAGELINEDDKGQRAVCAFLPRPQIAGLSLSNKIAESLADCSVDMVTAPEPVLRAAFLKPEFENFSDGLLVFSVHERWFSSYQPPPPPPPPPPPAPPPENPEPPDEGAVEAEEMVLPSPDPRLEAKDEPEKWP